MTRLRLFPLLILICILFTGCSASVVKKENRESVFDIPYYGLSLTADSSYSDTTDGSPWDLQISNGSAYISLFAFDYIDLAEDQEPLHIYDLQNEDIFSRRDNVTLIEDVSEETYDSKTITRSLYSAELDGSKNYYASYLIDFKAEEKFAWVLVTSLPSYWEKHSSELESIVYTMQPANSD